MKKHWTALLATAAGGLLVIATALNVWSQTAPYLTVAPTGTNQLLITITNASSGSYELWTTPVLGNTGAYPWTTAAVGTNGQNTFVVPSGPYLAGFFQALLDTNAIPLWQAAIGTSPFDFRILPLSKIIAPPGGIAPPPKLAINPPTDLMHIASKKKVLTWLAVSWLVFGFGPIPSWLYPVDAVCLLIVHVAMVIVSWHLARLMQKNVVLWIGLTVVPLVNLVAVARLVSLASLSLKRNAVRAGLADAP